MKLNFCTLFNQHYLSRGIALIESLYQHCDSFHLYVFAFDEITKQTLDSINYKAVSVISLEKFEDNSLLKVKKRRTFTEYCWTCTPAVIRHLFNSYNIDHCTYLDADIYFFDDPRLIINQVIKSKKNVLITPHNFTSIYDRSDKCGKFCVQFMYFTNKQSSLEVLDDWYNDCMNWCFNRYEDGKFGDQMYLDRWPSNYKNIYILEDPVCLGPWNINSSNMENAIFYHFHSFKINKKGSVFYGWYVIPKKAIVKFYTPYKNKLMSIENMLLKKYKLSPSRHTARYNVRYFKNLIHHYVNKLKLLL